MAKEKENEELSLEEAQNIVRKLSHPDRKNEEFELLKQASATIAKELQPEFEFEEEDEEGGGGGSQLAEELSKPPGFLEQMGSQIAAIGPAGVIALSSAAYFQIDTVVEETRVVQQVAEEKWEEVKFEHPNIDWDDPLAGFTTIIGVGEIDIDLDPPDPQPQPTSADDTPTDKPPVEKAVGTSEEDETSDEGTEESQEESSEEEPKEEKPKEEKVEEEPKKKKKKGLFGLFGGNDEEEEEQEEEKEEPAEEPKEEPEEEPEEPKEEEADEPKEEVKESNEPEPEAEEPVEQEKPKKKSGGLFSFLGLGGDDKESEEPEVEEPGETTNNGDTIPDEQTQQEPTTESETKTFDGEITGGESEVQQPEDLPVAEQNGIEVEQPEIKVEEPEINIQDFSEGIQSGEIEIGPGEINVDDAVEKVITPHDSDGNSRIVSPSGFSESDLEALEEIFRNATNPYNLDNERDATPT